MNEKLLQFIWQFQYFNRNLLSTTEGEPIEIIHPGSLNTHQGPDFNNAQVRIGSTTLAGSIEIHVSSSEWLQHQHQFDVNYKKVILHVVFENDKEIDNNIPVLELQSRISGLLLDHYSSLIKSNSSIACSGSITRIKDIIWLAWKDRLIAERLKRKSEFILGLLKLSNFHWEETLWWMVARNFGMKVNMEAFEEIAKSLPLTILAKHKYQIHQLEGLLLGQAGLLNDNFKDDYPALLQREYLFLKKKYSLKTVSTQVHFLRMRPGNFPTIRLAQLAMLIHTSSHLFARLKEMENINEIREMFTVTANDYWLYHYLPDEVSTYKKKNIGKSMIDNVVMNTVIPVLFAYGLHLKEEKYKERAILFLQQLPAESNHIIDLYNGLNIKSCSAFDTQALIELKTMFCDQKNCLKCAVGNSILKGQ